MVRRGRILLLDDDPDARLLLAALLEAHLDVEVLAVAGIAEALRVIERARPDVLVSDGLLGHETALDLLEKLAQSPAAGLPVVVVTASDDEEFAARLRAAGVRAVIEKPPDPGVLADAVGSAMDGA